MNASKDLITAIYVCPFLIGHYVRKRIQIHCHVAFYVFIRHYFEFDEFYQLY